MREFSPNCFEKISHKQHRAITAGSYGLIPTGSHRDSPHGVSLWVFKPCSQISAEYRRFIAIRQSITEIPAHCQHDHFPGEPEARERRWWRQNRTSTGCDACAERAERRLSAVQQYHLISTRINSLACLGFAKCNNAPGTAQRPRICALTIFFL